MFTNEWYTVIITEYAERHFIKPFSKRYKNTWDKTMNLINEMLSHIDMFIKTSKAERIHKSNNCYIAKCEFKIAWSNKSPKMSWNRIIVYVDEDKKEVQILLLYTKTDIQWWNETVWWQKLVKENHKEIYSKFNYQI